MTTEYIVKADEESLREAIAFFELIGGSTTDVIRIAINKAGPRVRTASSQAIRKSIRLKAAYVNERLAFTRATRAKLDGRIKTPSRGLLLSYFSTDTQISNTTVSWFSQPPTPPGGIKVKVKPDRSATVFSGTDGNKLPAMEGKPFYVLLRNSRKIGIARRKKDGGVHVFSGPSISQVFNRVKDEVPASEIYTKETADAMRYLLRNRRVPQE
jgi:hypothetical protein